MKICIDTRWMSRSNSGVGGHIKSLLIEMSKLDNPYETSLLGEAIENPYFNHINLSGIKKKIFQGLWKYLKWPNVELLTGKVDLMHFTNMTAIPNQARRNIVTVHDLAFKKYPQTIEASNLNFLESTVPWSLDKANHIIAVSKNTKEDIMKYYSIPSEKITVIYNGIDDSFLEKPSESLRINLKHKYNIKKPFILSVGTLEPRKNYAALINAYAALNKDIKNKYNLLICGGNGWSNEKSKLQNLIERKKLEENIKLLGFIDRNDLKAIYSLASLYVHSSLYEGFGLGLIEAMAYDLPLISSKNSCHEEIAQNSALYFETNNVDDLALKIELLLIDKIRSQKLITNGQKRIKQFNWKYTAKKTLDLYKKVLLKY